MCCVIGTDKDKRDICETAYYFECSGKWCIGKSGEEEGVEADKHKSEY